MGDPLNGVAFFGLSFNSLIFLFRQKSCLILLTQLNTVSNMSTECALSLKCQRDFDVFSGIRFERRGIEIE